MTWHVDFVGPGGRGRQGSAPTALAFAAIISDAAPKTVGGT